MKYALLGIYLVYMLSTITSYISNNITFSKNFTGEVLDIYRKDSTERSIVGFVLYTWLLYVLKYVTFTNIIFNLFIYVLVFLITNLLLNAAFDKFLILRLQPLIDEIKRKEALKQKKVEYLFGKDEKNDD